MPIKEPKSRKDYHKEYDSNPVNKARAKARANRPEAKAKVKANMKARRKRLILLPSGNTMTTGKKDRLWTRYRLTPEQYDKMEQEHMNKCGLCKKDFTEEDGPYVDHNHKTGFIRGLLHHKCNSVLGHLDDDPKKAELTKIYLEESERKEELENLKKHNRKNNNIVAFKEGENEQENN